MFILKGIELRLINLMFAGNSRVYDGLLIAGLSIVKYCKEPITVFVLTMDLTNRNADYRPINREQIIALNKIYKSVNDSSSVVAIDVREQYHKSLANTPNEDTSYTPYALLRLLAEDILDIPDKVLYLDADIVANGDISSLYNVNIDNYEIAGVRDYYGRFFFYPNYLNSGVLLMNMKSIRQTRLLSRALKMCQQRKVFLPDQTAINKCARKKKFLPSKYNEQNKLKEDTVIRHFSMTIKFFPKFRTQNIKPWHIDKVHDVLKITEFDDILDEYRKIILKEKADVVE